MSQLYIPFVVAIASGFGVIAYKTPEIYKKLFKVLISLCIAIMIMGASFVSGQLQAYFSLFQYVDQSKIKQATEAYDIAKLDGDFAYLTIAAFLYFFFLYWLSDEVLNHRGEKKPK